jgi:hypothetical protein
MNTGENSFHSGLTCASGSGDIVCPDKGRLLETGRSSRRGRLVYASTGDLPCDSWVSASQHACGIPGKLLYQPANQYSDSSEASWPGKLLPQWLV